MKKCDAFIGAGLYAVALSAAALSLGNSRGTVVLGSPIDLAFDIQPDPGSDLASSCVTAQLVSGDVPIASAKVRVVPLPEIPGRSPAVRVQAFVAANEPVLTATVTAGCAGPMSRTYTFLAEPPEAVAGRSAPIDLSRLAAAVPVVATPGAASSTARPRQAAAPAPRALPAPVAVAPAPRASAPPPPPAPRKVPAAAAVAKAPAPVDSRAAAKPPAVPASQSAPHPRLVMEPVEDMALRPASELAALPAQTPASERAQAAAAWKALNAEPGAADTSQERVRELEAQVAAMKAQAAKERAGMQGLRERLDSIEADRYSSTVVYALALLLALVAGLAAWLWRRGQVQAGQAWRDSVALMSARDKEAAEHALIPHPADDWDDDTTLPPSEHTLPMQTGEQILFEAPDVPDAPGVPATEPAPMAHAAAAAVPAPQARPVRAGQIVNPEELFDILQQAEFFISVGEHDQAIGVLKQHIADRGETSPFAYLELLRLYHQLGRAEDFERLRAQFLRYFNADLPAFQHFRRQGRGLDHYIDALAEIEAQWTSSSILALLEGYLFHQEGRHTEVPPFDLAAYDDLLLLLAIAQTTPASARGAPPPRKRTTPFGPPPVPVAPEVQPVEDWGKASTEQPENLTQRSLDSLIGDLELVPQTRPALAERPISEAMLDLDLSEPPPIIASDVPAVPVTAPPAAGQPVGFGMSDDKREVRFELETKPPKR